MATDAKAATFTLFPQLPFELRLKIWEFTSLDSRTVVIQFKPGSGYNSTFSRWRSPNANPMALQICRESREEALKSYEKAFGSANAESKIYFDFSRDILRFGIGYPNTDFPDFAADFAARNYQLDLFLGGGYHGANDAERVQFMVIEISEDIYGRRSFCWDEVRLFPALKKLTILSGDHDGMAEELMRIYRTTLGKVSRVHTHWVVPEITVLSMMSGSVWGTL